MRTALINGRLLNANPEAGESWLLGMALIMDGNTIEAIVAADNLPDNLDQVIDVQGDYITPGFFDTQVNGGGGVLLNDQPNAAGLAQIAKAHRAYGTTYMLPTLISDDLSVMSQAIAAAEVAMAQPASGIVGLHLEGPFLSSAKKGIHNAEKFRQIDYEALSLLTGLKTGKTLVTLAPEKTTADVIKSLVKAGVVVAAGHTNATYEQTKIALAAGISSFTHLFNAMTAMESRTPGCVGAALEDRNSWCGIIVDGYHVHPATLKVAINAKARGKMVLVTDAMPSVGAREKSFVLYGETITASNGRCASANDTLAGSDLDMMSAVRNSVEILGLELAEAVRMATLYPAQMMGIDSWWGSLAAQQRASVITFSLGYEVTRMWIDGQTQFA